MKRKRTRSNPRATAERIVMTLRDHLETSAASLTPGDGWLVVDSVNHPQHYNAHPSGVECITVTEHMNFNVGNAVKYLWRAGIKSEDAITDLEKARWYVEREIARLKKAAT